MKFGKMLKIVWFDSELIYNEKYLKTKTKPYNENINTNFQNDKIPKEGSWCIFYQ